MKKVNSNHERGMITVEAVLSLVPFILAILSIISLTNVFIVHNKIQYAIYQASSELAAYTYFYEVTGVRGGDMALGEDIERETTEINDVIGKTTSFLEQLDTISATTLGSTVEAGNAALEAGFNLVMDPADLLRNLAYKGIEVAEGALKGFVIDTISSGLVPIYIDAKVPSYSDMSADEYLRWMGVQGGIKGLDYSKSEIFMPPDYKMIDIVVEYDIEVYFLHLLSDEPTVHVVQRCTVPAWLDGDGVHY